MKPAWNPKETRNDTLKKPLKRPLTRNPKWNNEKLYINEAINKEAFYESFEAFYESLNDTLKNP